LHLVGILFPHINDDAQSKSLQIFIQSVLIISCKPYALLRSMMFLFHLFTYKTTGACKASYFQLHFLLKHISLTIQTLRDIEEHLCAY